MRDQPFSTSFREFKLALSSQFDMASNQRSNQKATILHGTLKFHHGLGQSFHVQRKECLKDPRIANAKRAAVSVRPNITWMKSE